MIERLNKIRKRYKYLVQTEGKDEKIKNYLKKIYKAKQLIKELELRINK